MGSLLGDLAGERRGAGSRDGGWTGGVRESASCAKSRPSRLFANALVNVTWHNEPVEDIHAGSFHGYALTQRRVTQAEEKELMQAANDGLVLGMTVCSVFAWERPLRPWPEQVLPYGPPTNRLPRARYWTMTTRVTLESAPWANRTT